MLIDKHLRGRPARFVLRSPGSTELTNYYRQLFGWEALGGGTLAILRLQGKVVAEVTEGEGGWLPYLGVRDLATALELATAAGATLTEREPVAMDTVILDPTDTALGLVETDWGPCVEVMAEDGAVVWVEQKTHDQGSATGFLTRLFGYEFVGPAGPGNVRVARTDGSLFGGVMQFDDRWAPDEKPHWLLYFQVADVLASLERAVGLGGALWFAPFDTPLGLMAYLRDPHGNPFAIVNLSAQGSAMTAGTQ